MPELRIAHVSTYSPTQCGIATYTEDLIASLHSATAQKIRLSYDEPPRTEFDQTIPIQNEIAYDQAATYINNSDVNIVALQHEFAIFGGDRGSHVLRLMCGIRKPIVTTLHTVKTTMSERKQNILSQIAVASTRLIVLTSQSKAYLTSSLRIPASKVAVIPHGIPSVPFTMPQSSELRRSLNASVVFISAGHRRRTKGYHLALEALARYKTVNPDFKYVIVGTHQPQFHGPPNYRQDLRTLADNLGLAKQVVWIDSYLGRKELLEYIRAADIGLVTYTCEQQNASGILPLFLGCGRVVVATGFECARSMQREVSGLFLPESNSPDSVATTVTAIAEDKRKRNSLMTTTYAETRSWLWSNTAQQYCSVFEDAIATASAIQISPSMAESPGRRGFVTVE